MHNLDALLAEKSHKGIQETYKCMINSAFLWLHFFPLHIVCVQRVKISLTIFVDTLSKLKQYNLIHILLLSKEN